MGGLGFLVHGYLLVCSCLRFFCIHVLKKPCGPFGVALGENAWALSDGLKPRACVRFMTKRGVRLAVSREDVIWQSEVFDDV